MRTMSLATKRVVLACFCAGLLTAVGCAGSPTNASTVASGTIAAAELPRSGELHVTKECHLYAGKASDFCTITSSNLDAIEVNSTVVYAQPADFGTHTLDSDVVLNPPEPGNNLAFGHCHLDHLAEKDVAPSGQCTFSGGTGKFAFFRASVSVSRLVAPNFAWDGTYSFSPRD